MNVFNGIMNRMNTQLNIGNRLTLLISPSELDTDEKIMILCNHIFDAIGSLIPLNKKIESISEIDNNEKLMGVYNGIISILRELGISLF